MRKWMKATSVTALVAAGLLAFGAGTAHANGGHHHHGEYDNDSINAATSGNGSILGGNQIIADVDVPINACGIAVGALLGVANAECEESGAIAD
ncbi:DUF320 domain-containing protein [Spiractinospora alimapuensis]|uniref:DUF320 domain-containing protein n=1 Tax=Spiractinospora alimapuensis TaxID=2820884 RepID=UPI001F3B7D19|nr:DUF320 domain-containing protein [Spiractinospora alimapuensis]QVQ50940.1 DUF320 domain-containing protein [Spiractinospora alimapuensis]